MGNCYLGIGIGGNGAKIGLVHENGTLLRGAYLPIAPTDRTPAALIPAIASTAISLQPYASGTICGCGIGFPGFLTKTGTVVKSPNMPAFDGLNLPAAFSDHLGDIPVVVANDANTYAVGELRFGIGRDLPSPLNLLGLTLGTGVGGGIILEGALYIGDRGMAGELGHIKVAEASGIACGCGKFGCIETVCGELGFQHMRTHGLLTDIPASSPLATVSDSDLTPRYMADLADAGDRAALGAWYLYGRLLGRAIGQMLLVLNIDEVVLGGGIAHALGHFFPGLSNGLTEELPLSWANGVRIWKGRLDDRHAEILGAGALAISSRTD